MFDHIRAADRVILLLNTLLLMMVAFLPFTTSVLAGALRSGHGQRTAAVFYGIAFDATALTFNAIWQYARCHRLLKDTLDPAGRTAIGRRFQLALAWLAIGALLGLLVPFLGVAVIAAFNVVYWLPIRGESPRRNPDAISEPGDSAGALLATGSAARCHQHPYRSVHNEHDSRSTHGRHQCRH